MQELDIPVRPVVWAHRAWVRDRLIEQRAQAQPDWYPRIAARFEPTSSGCHRWTGARDAYGYGVIGMDRGDYKVHRIVWLIERGPLALGWVPDHLCWNRECINVEHLSAQSFGRNAARRGDRDWRELISYRPRYAHVYPVFIDGRWVKQPRKLLNPE